MIDLEKLLRELIISQEPEYKEGDDIAPYLEKYKKGHDVAKACGISLEPEDEEK